MEDDRTNSVKVKILDSARRIISEEGYGALSMRRVARDIGYSATAIYLYFENKDELVHSLIDDGMDRLYAALSAASVADAESCRRLESVLRAFADFGLQNPEYYEIMFMLHPRPMQRYPAENYRRARRNLDLISDVIDDALPGGLSRKEAQLAATTVWASVHGAVALIIAGRIDASIRANCLVDHTIAQVMAGLVTSTRSPEDR